eukprot:m.130462 g.130462  ORF g.130462 m.130462 type:complete len:79 (+) comp13713_c0_seq4:768-1004(+)
MAQAPAAVRPARLVKLLVLPEENNENQQLNVLSHRRYNGATCESVPRKSWDSAREVRHRNAKYQNQPVMGALSAMADA